MITVERFVSMLHMYREGRHVVLSNGGQTASLGNMKSVIESHRNDPVPYGPTIYTDQIFEDPRVRSPGTNSAKKWKPQLFVVVQEPDKSGKRIQAPFLIQNLLSTSDEFDCCFPLGCAATSH